MKAVILISGNGSNLQSIIDHADKIDLQISAVISNRDCLLYTSPSPRDRG
mgnify:CR=1 FL=1